MKKEYIKPTINSVEFKVEMGFAESRISVANGISIVNYYNEYSDINNNTRFTRSTDLGGHVWNSDGTNSGNWD